MSALGPALAPLSGLLLLAAVGCGGAERVEADPHWPVSWQELDLYRHEHELAYASSGGAAAEICSLAREVSDDFRERTGAEPVGWIHVVSDRGDPSVVAAAGKSYSTLVGEMNALVGDPAGAREIGPDLPAGVDPALAYALMPIVVPAGALLPAHPEPTPIRCETLLPTSARLGESLDRLIDAGLDQEGIPTWKRILIAPFLSYAKGVMRRKLEGVVRLALFRAQVESNPAWSAEERAAFVAAYSETLGLEEEWEPPPESVPAAP